MKQKAKNVLRSDRRILCQINSGPMKFIWILNAASSVSNEIEVRQWGTERQNMNYQQDVDNHCEQVTFIPIRPFK